MTEPQSQPRPPYSGGSPDPATQRRPGFTGPSIGAVIAIAGAVVTLIAYPLVWYRAKIDDAANITGLGTTHSTDTLEVTYETNKLHWLAGAAAIVLIVVAVARLIGKFSESWVRPTVVVGVIGVLGAIASAIFVDGDFKIGVGVYLAIVGTLLMLAGSATIAILKR